MIELRWLEREELIATVYEQDISYKQTVKVLQFRQWKLNCHAMNRDVFATMKGYEPAWTEWEDVPTVESEDDR